MKAIQFILAAAVVLSCTGCSNLFQYEKPSAQLQGVSFGNVTASSAVLNFDVQLSNPYPLKVPLIGVDYTLTTRGASLLTGEADLASAIPAKSAKTVTLPVEFRYTDLIAALTTLRDVRPGASIPYELAGGLKIDSPVIGVTRLPLKKAGTLDVPTLNDVNWQDMLKEGKNILGL